MGRKKEYKYLEEVGSNHIKFIREIPKEERKSKRRRAIFLCPLCGNEFEAEISNIRYSDQKGCTCNRVAASIKNGHNNAIDISGQRFGNLVAIKPIEKRSRGYIIWECRCDCGTIHYANVSELQRGSIKSCGCINSFAEQDIIRILQNIPIKFEYQKKFEDCINPKTNQKLRFDFYLPDYNTCIEYDGVQHFKEHKGSWDRLEDIQYRDNLKDQYCEEHNIKLIRIPYIDKPLLNKEYILNKLKE